MADVEISLSGTLGRDPELRYTSGGRAVASASCAIRRAWKDRNDEWQEETSWIDLVMWGELGEHAAASLAKGDRVVVRGRIEQRSWETDSGDKRSKVEVVVDDIGPSLRWATATVEKIQRDKAPSRREESRREPEQRQLEEEEEPF